MPSFKLRARSGLLSFVATVPEVERRSGQVTRDRTHDAQRHSENRSAVRLALRLPAEVHELIRLRANERRLSINQAIVQAIEKFSGSPNSEARQEVRDLLDICRIVGTELSPELKRAVTERVRAVYGFDLLLDFCSTYVNSEKGGDTQTA